jgi:YidC/Oxa1 family membrane protein insertase
MDRKGWIILLLCGAALAANIVVSNQNKVARAAWEAEQKDKEEAAQPAPGTPTPGVEPGTPGPEGTTPIPAAVEESFVNLTTEDAVFEFTTNGGGLKTVEIIGQHIVGDEKEDVLINRFGKNAIGALTKGTDTFLNEQYRVVSQNAREVVFTADQVEGLEVTKKWSLFAEEEVGSGYRLHLEVTVKNTSEQTVQLGDYGLALGTASPLYQREWPNQTGVFHQSGGDYGYKHSKWFKGGKRPTYEAEAGSLEYIGNTNQFFTTIVRPDTAYEGSVWATRQVVTLKDAAGGGEKDAVAAGFSLPKESLAPNGGVKVVMFELLTGPKKNLMLRKISDDYGPVMNYGWPVFRNISNMLNRALVFIHDHVASAFSKKWSWGFAIVLLTILIRGVMWPLQNKSTRSMKRMSLLKEPIAELKAKHEDNPQKMNQEMMKLYREYGINPLGGCLPLVVQIPIFFGFYRMLQYAVELRQQKFLWVEDLSQPDTLGTIPIFGGLPLNILPIVMAGTMVIQMSLTPKTGDKMQARIFMLMPLIFFFFCYNFASALALYWTTSNIFAIAQTLITKRLPDPALKKKKKKKGPGFMEKIQARAEDMQKQKKRAGNGGGPSGGAAKPKKPRGPRTGG